jgi:hypothetical protein
MIASYVVLAKYDNEQSDMLYKLDADPAMKKVPLHQCVLSLLVSIRSAAPRVLTRLPPPSCSQRPAQVVYDARAEALAGDRESVRTDAAPVERL